MREWSVGSSARDACNINHFIADKGFLAWRELLIVLVDPLVPLRTAVSPVLGTNHSNSKQFCPHNGTATPKKNQGGKLKTDDKKKVKQVKQQALVLQTCSATIYRRGRYKQWCPEL